MLPEALRRGVGAQGAKDIKQLGRDIMAEVLGVDARGTPKGPLEAAAAKAVRADSDNVRKRIASLVARGDPTPADYYDILNKVLVDSGSIMLTDPKVVRGAWKRCGPPVSVIAKRVTRAGHVRRAPPPVLRAWSPRVWRGSPSPLGCNSQVGV